MCYTNVEVANLMMYGIEDVHYTMTDNGTIDISNNANYENYWPMFGDATALYTAESNFLSTGAETLEEYQERLDSWEVEMSPAYGFNFDTTNVKTEIAACDAVDDEYRLAISCGTVDPDTEIPKWTQKLYDAGLQKVIDEKQKQLDEWLVSQNEQ